MLARYPRLSRCLSIDRLGHLIRASALADASFLRVTPQRGPLNSSPHFSNRVAHLRLASTSHRCARIMSQPRRSIRKKRQTQLSFTPLPSSSPAASQYPEQIASRAASVRYGESPTKKQRVAGTAPTRPSCSPATSPSKLSFTRQEVKVVVHTPQKGTSQLPTPVASSQSNEKEIGM